MLLASALLGGKSNAWTHGSAWPVVFQENWQSLSLRTGGPTPAGYNSGAGTWCDACAWYRDGTSAQYVAGLSDFGYGYFVDHTYAWPSDYHPLGQIRFKQQGQIELHISPQSASILALNESWLIASAANSGVNLLTNEPYTGSGWAGVDGSQTNTGAFDGFAGTAHTTLTANFGRWQWFSNAGDLVASTVNSGVIDFNTTTCNQVQLFVDNGGGSGDTTVTINATTGAIISTTGGNTTQITSVAVSTVSAHQHLTYNWTPPAVGGWTFGYGTGCSGTSTIDVYNATLTTPPQPQENRPLSGILTGRPSMSIQPPYSITYQAQMALNPVAFQAVWDIDVNRSAAAPNNADIEHDVQETFFDALSTSFQSTLHYNTASAPNNPYQQIQAPLYTAPVPVLGAWATYEVSVDTAGGATFLCNGVQTGFIANPGIGAIATQAIAPIIDIAFGYSFRSYPTYPTADIIMYVGPITIQAPASNMTGVFPSTPPVPAITWRSGFAGGIVPHGTTSGTVVADLSGASTYSLNLRSAVPFSIVSSTLEVSGSLSVGSVPLYNIMGTSAGGIPAFMPEVTITVN